MRFGVCLPNYGETGTVETMTAVALEAERLGYDSVWTTDHILLGKNSGTPYETILESITSLGYLAAMTKRIRLGISSLIIGMRNPVVATKQLATVDRLSGGRLMLALGTGWNETEFRFLGSNFHDRGKRLNETVRLIRTLWRGGIVDFEGRSIPNILSGGVFEPRPVQDRLAIWIGGASKSAMRRAVRLGDAWHPNVTPLEHFRKMVSDFRSIPDAEQKPICVRIGLNRKATTSEYRGGAGERRVLLTADMDENRRILSELESIGASYAVIATSPDGKVSAEDQLEGLRMFASEFPI